MKETEGFKISSALKNLIGKELITDEFVAMYELVKNSFDAYAKNVEIIFEKGESQASSRIIIKDDGKGMNEADLKNKWLFVAYSAKKMADENADYRDKIKVSRVFAGAKGVGRFSCDRIGSKLNLITIKDEPKAKIENLFIDWNEFETDPLKEFYQIKVKPKTLNSTTYNIQHGTVLEISGIRDVWDRNRILTLKRALVKLINPNQENDSRNFNIKIIAKHELADDKTAKEDYQKVNGKVENKLFEQLKIKTTNISVEISKNGENIISTLEDRGDFIYKLTEKNPFVSVKGDETPILKNIKVYLFQLNQSAKNAFHKTMGMRSLDYGAVFMYKNGFRIYPFGEPGEDILLIDRRKGQGYSRFLGNRDLIGRIEIYGDNPELRETTSRDGGLVKTEAFYNLSAFFNEYVLRRLENYVVNIIKWGEVPDPSTGELKPGLWAKDVKVEILSMISGFINSDNVIDIQYNKDFLNVIEKKTDSSIDRAIKNISKVAEKSKNPQLLKEALKISKVFKEIKDDTKKAVAKAAKAEEKLEEEVKQGLFQKSIIGREKEDLLSLQHQIRHTASSISWSLDKLLAAINKDEPKEKLLEYVKGISLDVRKISSAAQFVTKANFNMDATKIKGDVVSFIDDYVENVFKPVDHYIHEKSPIQIVIDNKAKAICNSRFRPLELTVIVDNLFSNAKKAGAKKVTLTWSKNKNGVVVLSFKDDGKGIPDKYLDNVFDFGFSKTDGSGIGLYHVKQIIEKMGGSVNVDNSGSKGVEFILTFTS